jgi:hypothetical protein
MFASDCRWLVDYLSFFTCPFSGRPEQRQAGYPDFNLKYSDILAGKG